MRTLWYKKVYLNKINILLGTMHFTHLKKCYALGITEVYLFKKIILDSISLDNFL